MFTRKGNFDYLRAITHLGSLLPLGAIVWALLTDTLTANPIQDVTFRTGKAALVLLLLSLAATPICTIFKFSNFYRIRRTLGLYAFLYVSLHFLIFVGLDYSFNLAYLREAIFEKRFALVGFVAFLILIPLAITSTKGWQKRLGKNWRLLHKGVYLAGLLAVIHFVWLVKSDIREPLTFGAVLAILLALRIPAVKRAFRNFPPRNWTPRKPRSKHPYTQDQRAAEN
jgi:sulfoxide reductase heme-binding subunit YedZ